MKKHFVPTLLLFVLTATLALTSCGKLDLTPGLPEETTDGKGTFGCKVNDAIWLPYAEHSLDNAVEPEYGDGWFAVGAERENGTGHYIWLQLADSTGIHEKTYDGNGGFHAFYMAMKDGQEEIFAVKAGSPASITITKVVPPATNDRYAIVSGRFSFTAFSTTSSDSVRITDGRFDLKAL